MKSRSRHKPTQNSSALQCRLHKQEARCQKTHSCSPSSVWVSSHLEHIVAEMAGETTYDHMKLCRRLSNSFTQADLPSSRLPSAVPPYSSSSLVFILQISSLRCACPTTDAKKKKNRPEAKCLQLWWCECEQMGLTGVNLARRVRPRIQTNKMWGKNFCSSLLSWYFNC